MEEQRKFKILKNKLEAMNYRLPFSHDSMPLVDALLNDVSSLNSTLSRIRLQKSDPESIRELSERIEFLNREKLRLEEELQRSSINANPFDDREILNKSITDLRKENKALSQRLLSIQSSKSNSIDCRSKEYIEKLFTDFNFLKKQLEDSEENSQRLLHENRNLQDRTRILEGQIVSLRKEIEISVVTIKDITNEKRSTTEEYYSLKKIIGNYESKCAAYEEENISLRGEIQKVQIYARNIESQLSGLNKELGKSRNEMEMNSSTKARLSSQLDSLQRQIDILQNENNQLHILRDDDRKMIIELENKCKEIDDAYKTSQDKIRVIQRESQNFCDTIREKSEEIRNRDQTRKDIEKELYDTKIYISKYEESQGEIFRLKAVIDDLSAEVRKYSCEAKDLKSSVKYKEDDAKQYKAYLDQANKDIEIYKRKLDEENMKIENLNHIIRSYSQTEEQLRISKCQYEDSILRERQLKKEIDQLQLIVQKSDEKLKFTYKQQDSIQSQLTLVEEENGKIQKNLAEYMAKDNEKAIEIGKYENKIRDCYCEIEDLKRKIIEKDQITKGLSDEIKDRHKAFIAEQDHVDRLNEQISQLKEFISSLESTRSDMVKKLENFQISDMDKDNTLKKFREELSQVRKQLQITEHNCNDRLIEREKHLKDIENLHYDNSRRSDEISSLRSNIKKLNNDIDDIKSKLKAVQESEENFKRSWRDSEIEKARVIEINHTLNIQLEDYKKSCSRLQSQLQDASKELVYNENKLKALEDKYNALSYEKESFAVRVEEIGKELRNKIELSASALRDKDDLSQKLRMISDEYDKLLRAYDFLNLDYKKLTGKSAAGENLIENLKKQEETYMRTIKKLEEDLRNAVRVAEMADYKRIDAEKTSENLIKDMHSAKSFNRELDVGRDELQRKIMTVENEKSFLETKCRSFESEINNLRSQLDYEKQRSDMESRSFIITKDSFRKYEIDEDKSRISKHSNNEQLVSDLYKQIEVYKTEGLKLEMNYMKLLDELNQTKHMLNRAEARIAELEISRR